MVASPVSSDQSCIVCHCIYPISTTNLISTTYLGDCSPALPCLFLTVFKSKDRANNGKQFYSCQRDKKTANSCGFFMWTDQARSREISYLMTNRRSELVQSQLQFPSTRAAGDGGSTVGKTQQLKQATLDNMAIRTRSSRRLKKNAAVAGNETADGGSGDEEAGSSTRATTDRSSRQARSADSQDVASSHTASTRTLRSSGSQQQQQQQRRPGKQAESQPGTKRKAPANDEFSDFSDGEVEELAAIEQRSGGSSWTGSTTRTRDAFATPNVTGGRSIFAAHYRDEGQAGGAGTGAMTTTTPNTGRSIRRVLFASDAQHGKGGSSNSTGSSHHGLDTPPNTGKRQRNTTEGAYTPSLPQRHTPHQTPTSVSRSFMMSGTTTPETSFSSDLGPGSSQSPADITADVLDILRSQKINPAVLDDVKGALDSFSRRTAGYERGRDRSRREIQRQQKRIAELEQRAAALENSRELDRAALKRVLRMEEEDGRGL